MKRVSKTLSLIVVLAMVLSLGVAAFAAEDDWADYQQYVISFAEAGAPTEEDAEEMTDIILACEDMDDIAAAEEIQVFFDLLGALDYDAWVDAGKPDADVADVEAGDSSAGDASDEASGEASDEAMSVEDAYLEYIYEFLLNELEVNSTMTMEQIEDEYMPLFEAGDYETTPADILFNGMLETGVAMTFEEFAEQYTPAAAAGDGDTSEEAYHDYLKEYVAAVPAVSEDHYEEFAALIDASDYETTPADMLFTDLYWGFSAMTYDEFVEAGGAYEIPDFDPDLTEDEEPE